MTRIVCDVDGVVVNLLGSIERILQSRGYTGFTQDRVLTYDFNKSLCENNIPENIKNTATSGEYYLNTTRQEIFSCFTDNSVYSNIEFYDLIYINSFIELLNQTGDAEVIFHTVSANQNIADTKEKLLRENIKGDYTIMHCISNSYNKSTIPESNIVIEDNPYQVIEYFNNNWFFHTGNTFYLVNSTYLMNGLSDLLSKGIDIRNYNIKVVQSVKYAMADILQNSFQD